LTPIKGKMDLNSKSIGLVLSVEVQRYHAGAIKFLEEQNIRPLNCWNKRRRSRAMFLGKES
jgi:hypothetical protein